MTSELGNEGWPDLVYRFIEHYKWEPQHLLPGQSAKAFQEAIRRHEVPLNFLLNLFLYFSRSETIVRLLRIFGYSENHAQDHFQLQHPWETRYTQPDCRIETESDRIFIEAKVSAEIKVEQVQKYLLLHAEMDIKFGKKRPYLFFLTQKDFKNSWRPIKDAALADEISTFLKNEIGNSEIARSLHNRAADDKIAIRYHAIKKEINYAASTWGSLGHCLASIHKDYTTQGPYEVDIRSISDFLRDLKKRDLWSGNS